MRKFAISVLATLGLVLGMAGGAATQTTESLHQNSDFTSNTDGWASWQGAVTHFQVAGNGFARTCRTSGSAYTLNDEPQSVLASPRGIAITQADDIQITTRVILGAAGQTITIKFRERNTVGVVVRTPESATYTAVTAGDDVIRTHRFAAGTIGNTFEVRLSSSFGCFDTDYLYSNYVPVNPPPPNSAPVVGDITYQPTSPQAGQTVNFTGHYSDADGEADIVSRTWDLDNDGAFDDASGVTASRSFSPAGTYRVGFRVQDTVGNFAIDFEDVVVAEAPPPPVGGIFDNPFINFPGKLNPAGNRPTASNSSTLVATAVGALRNVNGGRGPTIFDGTRTVRGTASDPTWTIIGRNTGSEPVHVPDAQAFCSSSVDPTIDIHDESDNKTVRLWGGDSGSCTRNITIRTLTGANHGVDRNRDGRPEEGIGTAWGNVSSVGNMRSLNVANNEGVKLALGNNLNAQNFVPPAYSYEGRAFCTGSSCVPHGANFCHIIPPAQVDVYQNNAALSATERAVSDAFWSEVSCAEGHGIFVGDGTGSNGANLYLDLDRLGVSETQARHAVRMPTGHNSGGQASGAWANSWWVMKVPTS